MTRHDWEAALLAFNTRDYRTAVERFERVLAAHPDHTDAREYLARAYFQRASLPLAERALIVVESLMGGGDFLCGETISLADCHLVPILDYFARTDDGRDVLARHPRLSILWQHMEQRPSVAGTRPSLG